MTVREWEYTTEVISREDFIQIMDDRDYEKHLVRQIKEAERNAKSSRGN